MPFIRQAAHVNLDWFSEKFPKLHSWLENHKTSKIFKSIMEKYDIWNEQKKVRNNSK